MTREVVDIGSWVPHLFKMWGTRLKPLAVGAFFTGLKAGASTGIIYETA
jgi:hypothetical protein